MLRFSRIPEEEELYRYRAANFYDGRSRLHDKSRRSDNKNRRISGNDYYRQNESWAEDRDRMKRIDDLVEKFNERVLKRLENLKVKVVKVEPKKPVSDLNAIDVKVEPRVVAFNDKKDEKIVVSADVKVDGDVGEKEVVAGDTPQMVKGAEEEKVDVDNGRKEEEKTEEILVVQSEEGKTVVPAVSSELQVQDDSCHRENLFQARCLVQEKVCKLVVDGGSCANVVSQEFVKKMELQVNPHPKPYSLRWLNSPDVLHIHKQAQVPIAIGDYIDTITCDIVPMDCAHVLLGRPWQYDRRAVHDGYRNTYKIQKDGQAFLLLPMTLDEAQLERFEYVRAKGQRNLSLYPCRSSKKKTKPPQRFQELPHVSKETPSEINAKIRGRIFSKKGRMMGIGSPQASKRPPKFHDPLVGDPKTRARVKRMNKQVERPRPAQSRRPTFAKPPALKIRPPA